MVERVACLAHSLLVLELALNERPVPHGVNARPGARQLGDHQRGERPQRLHKVPHPVDGAPRAVVPDTQTGKQFGV